MSAAWHIRQKKSRNPGKAVVYYKKIDYMDPTEVKWVETIMVGSSDITNPLTDSERNSQISVLNKELRHSIILSIETNLKQIECDGRSILHQWTVYHLGYKHRPAGK